jgi:hypothetical protein
MQFTNSSRALSSSFNFRTSADSIIQPLCLALKGSRIGVIRVVVVIKNSFSCEVEIFVVKPSIISSRGR